MTDTANSGAKPRVLIVDDVAANRLLLQMYLDRHGFASELASSGDEAVQLAATNPYDVILMDVQMPGVNGFDATRRIRSAEAPPQRTLIIAVTACFDRRVRDQCFAVGMDAYFAKPVDLRKFGGTLFQLLRDRPVQIRTHRPLR